MLKNLKKTVVASVVAVGASIGAMSSAFAAEIICDAYIVCTSRACYLVIIC